MQSRNFKEFIKTNKCTGLDFIKSVLNYERKRFDQYYILNSVYEDINRNFGIFPATKNYPKYFMGDITQPEEKIIFIGINPGYSAENNLKEQQLLENQGYFNFCCHLFKYNALDKKGLNSYFANIAGFLKRLKGIKKIDRQWLQNNLINLEMIPYHSSNTGGLRINNLKLYRETHFEIILRILDYLNPNGYIFINGFPTFEPYLKDRVFRDVISFEKKDSIWNGKIKNHPFIGLPFLNRPKGGKERLVKLVEKLS